MIYLKCLQINNGIGVCLCNHAMHVGTFFHDNIPENFSGILFTFVMSYDGKLYLLFQSEKLMIVHFTRNKSVSTYL